MIRFFASAFLFLFLMIFEFAFVHALPEPWSFAPLVLAWAIYLYQYLGSPIGTWWIFGLGVFTDFYHLGLVPLETPIFITAALLMFFLGQRFFTNRSLYGVIGNAVLVLFLIHTLHALWLFFQSFQESLVIPWLAFGRFVIWQMFFLIVVTSVLFFLSRKVRSLLKGLFIVSKREGL